MRIVVHDYSGHPFQVQLSRELARRGHPVLHLHCPSYLTGKGSLERRDDDPGTFEIDAVDLGERFEKYSYAKRVLQERRYGRLCAERALAFRPDVVLSSNTPLFAQRILLARVRRADVRFAFWQQDLYSVAMANHARAKLGRLGGIAGRLFVGMERRMLAASDAVVVISEDFLPTLRDWGLDVDDYEVIENWAPLDELAPVDRRNPWALEHGLEDRTVVLYSGTLGLKHDPGLLRSLAERLADRPDVRVVVISEGLGSDWLAEHQASAPLPNLVLLPFQPYARLPEVLGSADVVVAILEPEAGVFSVPSKVLSYHCAGRAILAAVPAVNLAARIIEREGSGVVVEPGDVDSLVEAARMLVDQPALRAELATRARAYALQSFDISHIGNRFEHTLGRTIRPVEQPDPQMRST